MNSQNPITLNKAYHFSISYHYSSEHSLFTQELKQENNKI